VSKARASGLLAAAVVANVAGCASSQRVVGPEAVLDAYASALREGRAEAAYELLSADARRELPRDAFERMVRENPAEARELGKSLGQPRSVTRVTATVHAANGDALLLVLENGEWRLDASAIDLYGQATPEACVRSFVRAYRNKRWDVLMRFVPNAEAKGLDAARLAQAWQGEEKPEMDRLVEALTAALPTARIEQSGDRARMNYGPQGTAVLIREAGVWKIEDFR
jgi:hypothetical protein